MGIRPEFRWWILTVAVVGVLLLISALALDRPNVVWEEGVPHCPHCRSEVPFYSSLCPTCTERYDWTVAPDEGSPLSRWSLSALEARFLRERTDALGQEEAVRRVAGLLRIAREAAKEYLEQVDRGRCGWCGGTGRDLASSKKEDVCPVCFGRGLCIACGGNRRVRVGDENAHRAWIRYRTGVEDVADAVRLPDAVRVEEVHRLARELVTSHFGTMEATRVLFWPEWPTTATAADASRDRLDSVLTILAEE